MNDPKPFAIGSGHAFIDHQPYLGGWIRVLQAAVAANGDLTCTHGLRVIPRVVVVLYAGTSFCAKTKVGSTAWSASAFTIQFDVAQPAGTVLWAW